MNHPSSIVSRSAMDGWTLLIEKVTNTNKLYIIEIIDFQVKWLVNRVY